MQLFLAYWRLAAVIVGARCVLVGSGLHCFVSRKAGGMRLSTITLIWLVSDLADLQTSQGS
jgi:hypothetical protein